MGIRELGPAEFFPMIAQPSYNIGGLHYLAPGDIAIIYNLTALYNLTPATDGTGMKMVVVGQVDVSKSLSDIDDFRTNFGLTKNDPQQTIVPGSPNPGTNSGDMGESKLDLEWSGAVARNATILFITADAASSGGVFTAAQYAIDQNLAPVISMSYGGCETLNVSFIPTFEPILQQANMQGISFFASSGDEGAAGCDANSAKVATGGLEVNYPASSPEVTGVGGNEFNEGSGNYWGANNGSNLHSGNGVERYTPRVRAGGQRGWGQHLRSGLRNHVHGRVSQAFVANGDRRAKGQRA
jgi:subtilase family serine protease